MPWWGWLIAASVVWVTLVATGVYLYTLRRAIKVQREVMAEFDTQFVPPRLGSPRQAGRHTR